LIAGAVAARAFGVAMAFATGPIGLAIAAVAAIGVALWAFFTKTETGKKWWTAIWNGIKTAVSATWEFLKVAWQGILTGIQWIGDKANWLWTSVFQPVFGFIGSLVTSWWTGVVQPAFNGVKTAFEVAGNVISWWWNSIVTPAFTAVGAAISYFWDTVGSPIFNNLKVIIGLVGDAISYWWKNVATPAFQAVGAVISWLWDSVGSPIFNNLKTGIGLVGDAFSFFKDNVITPVFDAVGTVISGAWDNVASPIFEKLKTGIGLVGDAFGRAGGVIKAMWSGVADTLRPAVHFLGGILAKIPSKLGTLEIPGAGIAQDLGNAMLKFRDGGVVPALATGGRAGRTLEGRLWGPGTGTSDSILGLGLDGIPTALVSAGEGVVRTSAMRRGGDELVAALNAGWVPPAEFVRAIVRGGARLWHGDYDGSLNTIGLPEDSPLVAGAIGLRDLLVKGDFTSNLRDATGLEEDHPLISAALGARALAYGDYDPRLRQFGIEEDSPLVAAGLGMGALLGRGDYNPNLRQFGIEEDHPLVDAGIGIGALARGDYNSSLRRFGIEEDSPLISAALGARDWLASLPGLANGGVVDIQNWARGEAGKPYQYGGTGNPSWDCSGIAGGLYAKATGKPTNKRYFTTNSDFGALGWKPGLGGPTDLSIGTNGGLGTGGHMASTVGGLNVESSGSDGVEVGAGALGAADFPKRWHIPLGGNPTGGGETGGANLGGSGGLGSGVGSGASSSTGGTASSSSSGTSPSGSAVHVLVDNWPTNLGAATTSATPVGGEGVEAVYNQPATAPTAGAQPQDQHPLQGAPLTGELFNGPAPWWMASTPEQAFTNLGTQAANQWQKTAQGAQALLQDNWKEMLQTGAAVVGMGIGGGGGDTYHFNGMDPNSAAAAVERVQRRKTLAQQRGGGFGR
jgi:hypothetical protein